jgi:Tol biopolymer transport system component/predicted Ser/Thr protein kinase
MPLNPGSRLGPYEIVAPIGAGGMGEVYRATDTRLDRVVAIKVLSDHLTDSAEGRERFLREAKTISRLSHSNICALYDVGEQDGVDFLVMEFLEGETLAARLTKGPLPIEHVLRYGVEIADALDRAHRQRVVHRDLKPGNLMLTKSGVKLLDFGLAKLQARPTGVLAPMSAMATDPGGLTTAGTIVGTLQYMAPEQLEGGEADARSDIFSFGVILYEMATGQKAFSGSSHASVIANIMKSEPQPIFTLAPLVPPPLERLIRRCLAKDPDDRWQTARDLTLELRAISGEPALLTSPSIAPTAASAAASAAAALASATRPRLSRETLAWALAAAATLAAAGLALVLARRAPGPAPGPAMRFLVPPPENATLNPIDAPATISPDGTRLLFGATGPDGRPILWLRPLDAISSRPLLATDDARDPFWSPDGRSIAFFGEGKLKRMDANGGPPATICEAPDPRGGAWGRDGIIVFAPNPRGPLMRVKAEGGEPSPATALDADRHEVAHLYPQFLPDGKRFLYLVRSADNQQDGIYAGSTVSRSSTRVLASATRAAFAAPGWLLYLREGALMVQPFDSSSARLDGAARRLEAGVASVPETGTAAFSVSDNGVLAYQTALDPDKQLAWVDRSGRRVATLGLPGSYRSIEISPDGTLAAVERVDPRKHTVDIWRFDLARGEGAPFAAGAGIEQGPAWSADGSRLVYGTNPDGAFQISEKDTAGSAAERVLFASPQWKMPSDLSRDGKFLAYQGYDLTTKRDIWVRPLSGPRKPAPFLRSEASEWQARFSPDGRSVAYTSDESGRHEVYVAAYPGPGGKARLSTDGGTLPRWRSDGTEIFFVGGDGNLMAAPVKSSSPFQAGPPAPLFETRGAASYAVSPDGQRFLLAAPVTRGADGSVTIVANWPAFSSR